MIVDALLYLVNALTEAMLVTLNGFGGWATADPPDWLDSAEPAIETLFAGGASMGVWLPIQFGLTAAATVLAFKFAGLLVKIVRIVASLLTAGGGSAG